MESKDLEQGDVNFVPQTVRSLLDIVGEKQQVTNISPYIYKAPQSFRDLSPTSFTPRVVSIGPLHRENKTLQRFEVRKAVLVHDLLCRRLDSSPTEILTACVEKVGRMIKEIRECYEDTKPYDDSNLTKMMVMDACFILEFIHEMPKDSNLRLQDQHIPYDLLLLENQIPFFVLQRIYECTVYEFEEDPYLVSFLQPLLQYTNIFEEKINVVGIRTNINHDHILGYLHHCLQPEQEILSNFPRSTVHSVVQLDQAGIKFKPNQNAQWPMAMEVKRSIYCSSFFWFSFTPTLIMPTLRIDDFTELVLRNLIAYEQVYMVDPYVTSYARAMDMLIDTQDDIAKLVASKVMVNHIGSNEEAAKMINGICKEVPPEHFYYTQEWEDLDSHFNKYWPSKIVKLKQAYFNTPWSTIAVIAGFILFGLTLVQTIFAVK